MPNDKLLQLQAVYADSVVVLEGSVEFISMPTLKIDSAGASQDYAALLCPQAHSGYDTRLFLDRPVPGKGANWRTFTILGRTWYASSIRGISPNQPYLAILLAFLGHYK